MKTEFEFVTMDGEVKIILDFDTNTISFDETKFDSENQGNLFTIELLYEVDNLKNFKQMLDLMINKYEEK